MEYQTKLASWLEGANKIVEKGTGKSNALTVTHGKKYTKIMHEGYGVFAFIDHTNGDVLKAASWRAPAKHARGNIYDEFNGLSKIKWTGPEYLK